MVKWFFYLLVSLIGVAIYQPSAIAMNAGQYYYFISDMCLPKGPQTPEEQDAVTPDVLLFEVYPSGISDYAVEINTDALVSYSLEGRTRLSELETEQVYTAGRNPNDTRQTFHDFMLQREAIGVSTLVNTLNSFSQDQVSKGIYYRKLLSLNNSQARIKAVTRVRLIEVGDEPTLFLSQYRSDYYQLDKSGLPIEPVFISVDHRTALTSPLHSNDSQWNATTINGVCGRHYVR